MAEERLDLIKDVFNKAEYIKTINTSFSELGVTSITEDQQLQPTVEEFFTLYNSLLWQLNLIQIKEYKLKALRFISFVCSLNFN